MHNTRVKGNMWEGLEGQTMSDWLSNSHTTARSSSISPAETGLPLRPPLPGVGVAEGGVV